MCTRIGIVTEMLQRTFVFLMVIRSVKGTEPECSRFHHEEQTLEKMIRQEILVEAMKAEMGETKRLAESTLEALKQERESFNTEMEELKKAQTLEKEKFVRELAEIKGKMLIPGTAFRAKGLKNTKLTNGETLVFTNTVFDFGNGYSNQTGLFTAKISGLYMFSLHLCPSLTNGYMFYEVFTQESAFFSGIFAVGGQNYYSCFSSQVLITMQQGDKVGVKMKNSSISSGNNVIYDSSGSHDCVFSGVLINYNI